MTKQTETQALPISDTSGKCYIDPESTQIFIEALIKTTDNNTANKAGNIESLEMAE